MNTRWVAVLVLLLGVLTVPVRASAQRLGPERDLTVPMRVATAPDVVAMTTSGTRYVAAYRDEATVGTDIVVYDSGPISFVNLSLDVSEIACIGDDCLAAGAFGIGTPGFVRFRLDGTVLDAAPVAVAASGRILLAPLGSGFVVGVPLGSEFSLHRFNFATGVLGGAVFTTSGQLKAMDCGPSDCLVVGLSAVGDVFAQRLNASLAPVGAQIALTSGFYSGETHVAFTGSDYAVVAGNGYRIDAAGTVLTAPTTAAGSAVACDGAGTCISASVDDTFLIWTRTPTAATVTRVGSAPYQTLFACARPNQCAALGGMPRAIRLPDAMVSPLPAFGTRADEQTGPVAVAGGPRGSLALFWRGSASTSQLAVTPLGATPSRTARRVGDPVATLDLAYADDRFGLVTTGSGGGEMRVLGLDGAMSGSATRLNPETTQAALAWNGTHFLVAWTEASGAAYAQRFNTIGERVDPTPRPIESTGVRMVSVAARGGEFVVLYSTYTQVRARRVSADGMVLGTEPLVIRDHEAHSVQIRTSDAGYVAAWSEQSTLDGTFANYDIRVARLSAIAAVMDLGGRSVGTGRHALLYGPSPQLSVAPVRSGALVAWAGTDETGAAFPMVPVRTVMAATVDFAGGLILDEVRRESPYGTSLGNPSGLSLGGYPLPSLVFGRSMTDSDHRPVRVRVRPFIDSAPGALCSAPADCDSNFCVDGVCCTTACDGACDVCGATGVCTPMVCDAGAPDASTALDTGTSAMIDAGTTSNIDAAVTPPPPSGGCTASSRAPTNLAWLAALGVLLAARRRRRAH